MRAARRRLERVALPQHALDLLHGEAEILALAGPARRQDAGRAVERVDRQSGVVGKGRESGRGCGGVGLDARVVAKARAGFRRLGKAECAGDDRFNVKRFEQLAHFLELARIVGCDDEPTRDPSMHGCVQPLAYITASFCRSTSLAMPLRASVRSATNSSSL